MVARHEHGFKNENRIINKHGLRGAEGYTDKWDAIAPRASIGHGKHQKMYFTNRIRALAANMLQNVVRQETTRIHVPSPSFQNDKKKHRFLQKSMTV